MHSRHVALRDALGRLLRPLAAFADGAAVALVGPGTLARDTRLRIGNGRSIGVMNEPLPHVADGIPQEFGHAPMRQNPAVRPGSLP